MREVFYDINIENIVKVNQWSTFELRSSKSKIELIINGQVMNKIKRNESDAAQYHGLELSSPPAHWSAKTTGMIENIRLCELNE